MKNLIFIFMVLLIMDVTAFSQELQQIFREKSSNYKSIQTALHQDKSILENASPRERHQYEVWNWYWRTRVDSSGSFQKIQEELTKYAIESTKKESAVAAKSAPTNSWTCIGPNSRPIISGSPFFTYQKTIGQGLVKAIWVDPDHHDTILIGANNAGLWKTINGGTNWTCLTEGIMTGGVTDIAVHPTNKDIIYIVTQVRAMNGSVLTNTGKYSLGIFKTNNGGASWTRLNTSTIPDEEYFQKILIHPTSPSTLYALTINSVYKSTDSGLLWTPTSLYHPGDHTYGFREMEFKPYYPNTIYVSGGNAIYKSSNGGTSWTPLISKLSIPFPSPAIAIAVDANNPNDLFVFYCVKDTNNNVLTRLMKSTDCGENFALLNSQSLYAKDFLIKIWIAPDGDIFAGGIYIYRFNTGGQSFGSNLYTSDIHDDKRGCCFPDPNSNLIYLATDGGVYMDDDDGNSWTDITGDLPINEFFTLAITEQDPEVLLGGTADCGSYMRNSAGVWTFVRGGDGGTALINQNNYNIYYVTANGDFRRSDKPSTTLATLTNFDAPVIMDPTNSNILYKSAWISGIPTGPRVALQKSTDKGDSWPIVLNYEWNTMTDITICESDASAIYYTTWDLWETGPAGQIVRCLDGSTFEIVSYNGISDVFPSVPATNVVVHPFDKNQVWVTFGGFDTGKKVCYSNNGGNSWIDKTGTGLPDLPVQCFEYDFLNGYLYVGTDVGVYYKSINDLAWQEAETFPKVIVTELIINRASGDLVASTFGRGIYRTNLGKGYCYDDTPLTINTSTTWTTDSEVCSDVIIASGGTLTVHGIATMSYKSVITVESNGILKIEGGEMINGKIIVENGGRLEISDDGLIDLNYEDHLEIQLGGELDISSGEVLNSSIINPN
ncbi:MAG: hypothetical protein ABFS10_09950 [Bacteroidota bacterium]